MLTLIYLFLIQLVGSFFLILSIEFLKNPEKSFLRLFYNLIILKFFNSLRFKYIPELHGLYWIIMELFIMLFSITIISKIIYLIIKYFVSEDKLLSFWVSGVILISILVTILIVMFFVDLKLKPETAPGENAKPGEALARDPSV